jgi:hypothetical protein
VNPVENDIPDTFIPLFYPYDFRISMYFAYALKGFHTRVLTQWVMSSGTRKLTGEYQRSATQTAQGTAGIKRFGDFRRTQRDTAKSKGVVLRYLFIFLRLLTGGDVWDYIIGRFLKSKEELAIKSPVERETEIDSRIR